ncbi:hypothetical protein HYW83_06545 [Candidatus Peregrinibacteria bacterium]|nr:hypothetical protein [Candidatus Peregrinibacteria bacterium]
MTDIAFAEPASPPSLDDIASGRSVNYALRNQDALNLLLQEVRGGRYSMDDLRIAFAKGLEKALEDTNRRLDDQCQRQAASIELVKQNVQRGYSAMIAAIRSGSPIAIGKAVLPGVPDRPVMQAVYATTKIPQEINPVVEDWIVEDGKPVDDELY